MTMPGRLLTAVLALVVLLGLAAAVTGAAGCERKPRHRQTHVTPPLKPVAPPPKPVDPPKKKHLAHEHEHGAHPHDPHPHHHHPHPHPHLDGPDGHHHPY